jgi:cation diffusion facilitator CzcD-associated flavoprotein CzcO
LTPAPDRYAIIGAGPGGLCAARWMSALGLPFDLIERHPDLGGIWDIRFPGSPMYESAHFISSKTLSAFRDFPMPEGYPDYPSHRQVLAYLHAYADRHGLRAHAQFGSAVREVRPEDGGWTVAMEKGESRRYAGVILAIGQQWTPKMPGAAARFEGEAYHSSAYHSARQLDGKRVLVVGGGNSGCDIAVDAGNAAAKAFLSLRRGYWFVPKHVFGLPADVFGARGPHLPLWLERRLDERLLRLLLGDLRRLGLPAPDHRLFETHPVLNSQLLGSLAHGDVVVKPDVREFRGRRVVFADGSEEELDAVIFATGYRRRFPVLPESVHREGDVSCLYLNLCHRTQPGLFVVGFFETDGGAFPLIDLQCELIARALYAQQTQSRKARRFQKRLEGPPPDLTGGVRYLQVERMQNYVRTRPYRRCLAAAIKELS